MGFESLYSSCDTLRLEIQKIKGLQTGKRQLLYLYEARTIFEAFGVGN